MRGLSRLLLFVLAVLGVAVSAAAQPAFPERGTAPVVDAANIIDDATEAALTQKLDAFEQRTQRQFVVATVPSLEGYDIADYGYQLGRAWALGDAERNDGVILLVAPNERKMRIEVGYGLEGTLPDGLAFEYIEEMKPYFRDGNFSGGIDRGADLIMQQLELPPEEAARVAQQASQQQQASEGGFPIGALFWLVFVFLFFILPMLGRGGRRRRRRSPWGNAARDIVLWEAGKAIARGMSDSGGGGWGGGGGFGGGGFGGGGGSFGGGGASGGW